MRLLSHILQSALLVVAAWLICFHSVVLNALALSQAAARKEPGLQVEFKAAELVAIGGQKAGEPPTAIESFDWRNAVADGWYNWRASAPLGLGWEIWFVSAGVLLVWLRIRWPQWMDSVPCMFASAAMVAIAFFVLLNDIVLPSRVEGILACAPERHSLRNDFLQVTGLTSLPDDARASAQSATFKKAADNFLLARKDAKESLDLLQASEQPMHVRLWLLLERNDADVVAELEKILQLRTRVFPRPGNTWLGYAEPDDLRAAPHQHGFAGAALSTPEAIRGRLASLAPDDLKEAGKPSPTATVALKVISAILSNEVERVQGDLFNVVIRRLNGPFQFTIMLVFTYSLLLFVRRGLAVPALAASLQAALPRVPCRNEVTLEREETGGPIDRLTVEIERRKLEEQRRAGGFADNPGAALVHAALAAFEDTPRVAAAEIAVKQKAQELLDACITRRHFLAYCAWCIPSIGITATAFGIGNALIQAGRLMDPAGDAGEALQKFFAELGVTFDVTLFALACSIVMMGLLQRLQTAEENAIHSAEKVVQDVVVANLLDGSRIVVLEYYTEDGPTCIVKGELLKFQRGPTRVPKEKDASVIVMVLEDQTPPGPETRKLSHGSSVTIPLSSLTDDSYNKFFIDYYGADEAGQRWRSERDAWLKLRAPKQTDRAETAPRHTLLERAEPAPKVDAAPMPVSAGAGSVFYLFFSVLCVCVSAVKNLGR